MSTEQRSVSASVAVCLGLLLIACQAANASVNVGWSAGVTGARLYDSFNNALSSSSMYIELVVDKGTQTDFSQLLGGYIGLTGDSQGWTIDASANTDEVVASIDGGSSDGLWSDVGGGLYAIGGLTAKLPDTYASSEFYFRWFNNTVKDNATEAGFIYSSGTRWTLPSGPADPVEVNIALDYANSGNDGSDYTPGSNDGWKTVAAVPEPGSMVLFALGLVTLAVRRRRR